MNQYTGTCRYCGAKKEIFCDSKTEADDEISRTCECGGQAIENNKKMLVIGLDKLIGEDAEESGFRPVNEEARRLIHDAGSMICEKRLQSVSFRVEGTAVNIKGGEKIKYSRKKTYEQKSEI